MIATLDLGENKVIDPYPFNSDEIQAWEKKFNALIERYCERFDDSKCCTPKLKESTFCLHSELNIRQRYIDTLRKAHHFKPTSSRKWGWYELINTTDLRVGLISLKRFFPIPVHDHPGTFGIQKIITGKVRIRQYEFASKSHQAHSLVSLKKTFEDVLVKGGSSCFTPEFRNLHELESVIPNSVVLSLMANPYRPHERSWYFPIPMTQTGDTSLYNRIRKDIMLPGGSNELGSEIKSNSTLRC